MKKNWKSNLIEVRPNLTGWAPVKMDEDQKNKKNPKKIYWEPCYHYIFLHILS